MEMEDYVSYTLDFLLRRGRVTLISTLFKDQLYLYTYTYSIVSIQYLYLCMRAY